MKIQTPMSKLKDSVNKLKSSLSTMYGTLTLNKKCGDGYASMPVVPDHVLIFSPKNKKEEYATFAFNYDFADKFPNEHTVVVSIKPRNKNKERENSWSWRYSKTDALEKARELNKAIVYSREYKIEEFKELLKKFIAEVNCNGVGDKDVDTTTVIELVSKIFMNNDINLKSEVDKAVVSIDELTKQDRDKYMVLESSLDRYQKKLLEDKAKINHLYCKTSLYKRKLELDAELLQVLDALDKKKAEYNVRYGIADTESSVASLKKELKSLKMKIQEKINNKIKLLNNLVKDKARKLVKF